MGKPPERHILEVSILKDRAVREAIGAISVHWSVLELMVERVIATLEGNPKVVTYTSDLAHRLEDLKKLAWQTLPNERAQEIANVAGKIKTLRQDRHRAIHCLWGLDKEGRMLSLFPRDKRGNVEKPLSIDGLREIKLRIWREGIKPLGRFAPFDIPVELASRRKPI